MLGFQVSLLQPPPQAGISPNPETARSRMHTPPWNLQGGRRDLLSRTRSIALAYPDRTLRQGLSVESKSGLLSEYTSGNQSSTNPYKRVDITMPEVRRYVMRGLEKISSGCLWLIHILIFNYQCALGKIRANMGSITEEKHINLQLG